MASIGRWYWMLLRCGFPYETSDQVKSATAAPFGGHPAIHLSRRAASSRVWVHLIQCTQKRDEVQKHVTWPDHDDVTHRFLIPAPAGIISRFQAEWHSNIRSNISTRRQPDDRPAALSRADRKPQGDRETLERVVDISSGLVAFVWSY